MTDTTENVYDTAYEIGQDNLEVLGMDLHNPVFFISGMLILSVVIGTLMFPPDAKIMLDTASGVAGALNALQAGAITTALPFTVVLIIMRTSVLLGLNHERKMIASWVESRFILKEQ